MKFTTTLIDRSEIQVPKLLYKHRVWSKPHHKTLITKREVFFSPPSLFEDEKDCRMNRDYNPTQEELYNYYHSQSIKYNLNFSVQDHFAYAIDWMYRAPFKDPVFLQKFIEGEFKQVDEKNGVLSMTKKPDSFLMWNLYSDNGQGICIGIDSSQLIETVATQRGGYAAAEVKYFDVLPKITIGEPFETQVYKQVFCKEEKWKHEDEWRIRIFKLSGLQRADRTLKLPVESISEVIFGYDCQDEVIEEVISTCKLIGLNVKYYRAKLSDNSLTIVNFDNC